METEIEETAEIAESKEVLDGEYKFDSDLALEPIPQLEVVELPKSNKPFDKREDVEWDTLYYGNVLPCGLIEVRKRSPRDMAYQKYNDRVIWYEGNVIVNGEGKKIAYHVTHEPSARELIPDYLYPTTQWNITRALLSEQDNVPGWKRMVAMKVIQGQEPEPFRVMLPRKPASTIKAFHFVIVNRRYIAIEQNNKKIDGRFVLSPPASGTYIKSYRDAIKLMDGSPIGLMRQRASDGVAAIV